MNDSIEFFPNAIAGFRRDAVTPIFDANAYRFSFQRRSDRYRRSLGAVLDRIVHQVFDDLSDQASVSGHGRDSVGRLLDQAYSFLTGRGLQGGDNIAHDIVELERNF